ncbi:MAG: hypothetical protein E7486_06665 [Ruminococcaceae bacterium]|nr:hypothetical protein [Oscillospiraceae bacterium]
MKRYDEMAENVFRRMEDYQRARLARRKQMAGIALPLCGACLAVLVGVGGWQSGWWMTTTGESASSSQSQSNPEQSQPNPLPSQPVITDTIVIHNIEELPQNEMMYIALVREDFIKMTPEELNSYYGRNVFPQHPVDLKEKSPNHFGIYKRDQGTGELYCDQNAIHYINEDSSRWIAVSACKGKIPYDFCGLFEREETKEKSEINGVEVGIAKAKNGDFFSAFIVEGVGFRVSSSGLSQEEFITVLRSLVQ